MKILQDNKKESEESKSEEAAAVVKKAPKDENSSAEDLEAILENSLKEDDFDFDLNSPLSILLDDTDELDLLSDMMIQPSSGHFQHPRQPSQNSYAHCVNSYRQNGYQVRKLILFSRMQFVTAESRVHAHNVVTQSRLSYLFPCLPFSLLVKQSQAATKCHHFGVLCLHIKSLRFCFLSDSPQKQVQRRLSAVQTQVRLNFS